MENDQSNSPEARSDHLQLPKQSHVLWLARGESEEALLKTPNQEPVASLILRRKWGGLATPSGILKLYQAGEEKEGEDPELDWPLPQEACQQHRQAGSDLESAGEERGRRPRVGLATPSGSLPATSPGRL